MRYKSLSPSQRAFVPPRDRVPRERDRQAARSVNRARDILALLVMIALIPALTIPQFRTAASGPRLAAGGVVVAGEPVALTGTGFEPNTHVLLAWDGVEVQAVRSTRSGSLTAVVQVPSDATIGEHLVAATYRVKGQGNARRQTQAATAEPVASAVVQVVESQSDPAPETPAPDPTPATTASPTAPPTATPAPPSPSATPVATQLPSPSSASATPSATPAPTSSPPVAAPDAYVVATGGSDANPGSPAAPWRTLQHAASRVQPGDIVYVRGGTYAGFTLSRSGTSSAPIVFASYPGERAVVTGSSSTVNVIRLAGVHDVVLRDLTVQGAAADKTGAGIRIDSAAYRITVADSLLRENRSYGVSIVDSTYVTVRGNEITGNAEGVYVLRSGQGVLVEDNRIHHQDRMVVATVGGNDDHGGVGVALVRTSGTVTVRGNRIWGNRAVSPDYGYDGGAYEIFAASNVVITGNVAWDNRNVIETGSDGAACRNNVFTRNVHYGATTLDVSKGMVLRCAENMLIANNTFYRLDQFVFDVQSGGGWGTSVSGLRILNNIAVMASGKIYGVEAGALGSVQVDHNLVWHENGGVIGSLTGHGSTSSFSTFRSWTGFDAAGVNARPEFVDSAKVDLRLGPGSPAVNRAMTIQGVTSGHLGSAPDIGRHESY